MRVAVTGGRDYRDQRRVDEVLDAIHAATPIEALIHGDARGADTLAADWARRQGIKVHPYPARWDDLDVHEPLVKWRNGKPYNARAGLTRNTRMLIEGCPSLLVVFPGGTGTQHCRGQALRFGVAVMDVDP